MAVAPEECRVALLAEHHDRAGFECGVEALDRYLKTQAGQDGRRRIATSFVLTGESEPERIVGYYTLSALGIALAELPVSISKRLPRYPIVPATLMGRLAIDHRFQGGGLGQLLLFDALARALRNEIATFAFVVDPTDEAAARFYARYRFQPLTADSGRMFLPMAEVAALFA